MPEAFDVITFSDMCVDLIISGQDVIPQFGQVEKLVEDYTLELGGSCNIFACQAAKLGLRTAVIGRVGEDSFGRLILQRLSDCGVDTRYVIVDPTLKTGIGVALCPPGDRAILTYMGTINAVYPQDITDEILASTRHIHHGSHYLHTNLQSGISAIFSRARHLGRTTSLDPNWDPAGIWDGDLPHILANTTLFFPNDQEALHISRAASLPTAAQGFLDLGVGMVALKAGARGAWLYSAGQSITQPVTPISGGDSIGAGDSFDAGFLAGWLRGLPLERCLAIASHCGRSVASRIGGLAGQPTWEQVQRQF
jgi:ribokinase